MTSNVEATLNEALKDMARSMSRAMIAEWRRQNRMWEQFSLRDGITRIRWDVDLFPRARAFRIRWWNRYYAARDRIIDTWRVLRHGLPEADW